MRNFCYNKCTGFRGGHIKGNVNGVLGGSQGFRSLRIKVLSQSRSRAFRGGIRQLALFVEVAVPGLHICPGEPLKIPSLFALEVLHASQSVCSKDDAPEKVDSILITLDTSHLEMSTLNDDASWNMD